MGGLTEIMSPKNTGDAELKQRVLSSFPPLPSQVMGTPGVSLMSGPPGGDGADRGSAAIAPMSLVAGRTDSTS